MDSGVTAPHTQSAGQMWNNSRDCSKGAFVFAAQVYITEYKKVRFVSARAEPPYYHVT